MNKPIYSLDLTRSEKEIFLFLISSNYHSKNYLLTSKHIGDQLNVTRPRAHNILKGLEVKSIVKNIERKGFVLTNHGIAVLEEFIHRLKIFEMYLIRVLEIDVQTAQQDSIAAGMYLSHDTIDRMCDLLERPKTCIHSISIPHHIRIETSP